MYIRLLILVALFVVFIFSGPGVRVAHAEDFCSVGDILAFFYDGYSLEDVIDKCPDVNVERCDVEDVYNMIEEGFSESEIYSECG